MGGCLSVQQSAQPKAFSGNNERNEDLQELATDPRTLSVDDLPGLTSGTSRLTQAHGTANGDVSASNSGRSNGMPSTSLSEYSNVSAATPTSVLPPMALSSRHDNVWTHSYYMKVCNLREGSSGSVHLAVDLRYGNQVAIKFIPRGSSSVQIVLREVMNQRLCFHHPQVIQFREVFLTADHLAIVSEYAAGGDLADYIDRHQAKHQKAGLTEANALWLFHQLVTGVNFCHQMGIANRDIKLENTLLMDESERPLLKLCDFGYSKDEYQGSACKTLCGTPEYVAPEVLASESYDGKAADVWSCGVVLYTILTGGFPFKDPAEEGMNPIILMQRLFPRILAGQFDVPQGLSPECQSLLTAMLTVDPAKRIPAVHILQHPWLKKFDAVGELAQKQKAAEQPMAASWVMQTDAEIMQLSKQATQGSVHPQRQPRVSHEEVLPY